MTTVKLFDNQFQPNNISSSGKRDSFRVTAGTERDCVCSSLFANGNRKNAATEAGCKFLFSSYDNIWLHKKFSFEQI